MKKKIISKINNLNEWVQVSEGTYVYTNGSGGIFIRTPNRDYGGNKTFRFTPQSDGSIDIMGAQIKATHNGCLNLSVREDR